MERWPNAQRLLLITARTLTIQLALGHPHPLRITVEGVRIRLPRATPTTDREQRVLYPHGYPNLVAPLWEMWVRLSRGRAVRWVVRMLARWVEVVVCDVEVYSVPHVKVHDVAVSEESSNSSTASSTSTSTSAAAITLISRAIRSVRSAVEPTDDTYVENRTSSTFLTVCIGKVHMDLGTLFCADDDTNAQDVVLMRGKAESDNSIAATLSITSLEVFTNVDHLPTQRQTRTWKTPVVAISTVNVRVSLRGSVVDVREERHAPVTAHAHAHAEDRDDAADTTGPTVPTVKVPLAPGTPMHYHVDTGIRATLATPYRVDPSLIRDVIDAAKEHAVVAVGVIPSTNNDPHHSSLATATAHSSDTSVASSFRALARPMAQLWWDDLAVGRAAATVAASAVSAVVETWSDRGEAFVWEDVVRLTW